MELKDGTLYLEDQVVFEDFEKLLPLANESETIHIKTNDVHPSIWQVLFLLSETKNIIVDDEFNRRLFENLNL